MASRIRFTRAKQVFETFPELSESVREPSGDVSPQEYAKELWNGEAPLSVITYFAHMLPKRETVWWAMKCVAGLAGAQSDTDRNILALSEVWVREGDEESRVAVHAAAEAAKTDTAAVWVGFAAAWSGGSLSPNPDYRVEMPDDLTAKAAGTALFMVLGTLPPAERDEALKSCLSAGLSFAEGGAMPAVSIGRQPQTHN